MDVMLKKLQYQEKNYKLICLVSDETFKYDHSGIGKELAELIFVDCPEHTKVILDQKFKQNLSWLFGKSEDPKLKQELNIVSRGYYYFKDLKWNRCEVQDEASVLVLYKESIK